MKEIKIIEDIISNKLKLIDAYTDEINEVFQSLNLLQKKVAETILELDNEDDVFDTKEFLEYQEEGFRDSLLKNEATELLREVVNSIKVAEAIGVEFSEDLKKTIEEKDYLKESDFSKVFVLNKLGKLEEREKGLYNKKLQDFMEKVKEEINVRRGNTSTN